jgi:hypothetical protein
MTTTTTRTPLEEIELRLCQTRLASGVGREAATKRVNFLLGQIEAIGKFAREAAESQRRGAQPPATTTKATARLVADACLDADGFVTIRHADGTPNGDTDAQPVATVYDEDQANRIVRAVNSHEALVDVLVEISGNYGEPVSARKATRALAALAQSDGSSGVAGDSR